MVRVASHVGMQQPDVEVGVGCREKRRQIVAHLTRRVADTIDRCSLRLVRYQRKGCNFGSKPDAAFGQVQAGFPPVQGVVVAVADEGTCAGPVELLQSIYEAKLGPQTAVSPVVSVTGHQEGVYFFLETEINNVPVSVEGGVAEGLGHMGGSLVVNSPERAVQVQVGGMYEAKFGHRLPFLKE